MGFFRQQEEKLAVRLLKWQYDKLNKPQPDNDAIKAHAGKIVEEAHRIAREKSLNIYSIMKDLVNDLKK